MDFFPSFSIPTILLGERELSLVLDNTTIVWVSKLRDEIGNRVYVMFENLDVTDDKFTA